MEDIQRDLGRQQVITFTPPKFTKKINRRTLLYVDSFGRTEPVNWLGKLTMTLVILLVVAMAGDVLLFTMYKFAKAANRSEIGKLTQSLAQKDAEIKKLKANEETLSAKLVLAGKKSEDIPVTPRNKPVQKPPTPPEQPQQTQPLSDLPEAAVLAQMTEPQAAKPEAAPAQPVPAEPIKPVEPAPLKNPERPKVGIEEFGASYKQNTKTVKVYFNITNTDPKQESVSGFMFLALKPETGGSDQWVVLPEVSVAGGRPGDYLKGQTFSISRARAVNFDAEGISKPVRFRTATVFVFDKAGEVMLVKDFPLGFGN